MKKLGRKSIATIWYFNPSASGLLCCAYGRIYGSFKFEGVRYYKVKQCDSMSGDVPPSAPRWYISEHHIQYKRRAKTRTRCINKQAW